MHERVLIVDDDPTMHEVAGAYLEREGHRVYHALDGADALGVNAARRPGLLILDRRLPDMPGEAVLEAVRQRSSVPVMMVSAHAGTDERVRALALGADDYLSKPFSPRELVARVKALLRRSGRDEPACDTLSFDGGRLEIDLRRREVRRDGEALGLTPSEYKLLLALGNSEGRAYSRTELVYRTCGHDFEGYERSVDQHVKNLRRKLEPDPAHPRYLQTIRGYGYSLRVAAAQAA